MRNCKLTLHELNRQRSAFIPFSYGPRSCVGRNVAEVSFSTAFTLRAKPLGTQKLIIPQQMELSLIVSTVFRRYEFEPYQKVLETREGFLRKPLGFDVGMRRRQKS